MKTLCSITKVVLGCCCAVILANGTEDRRHETKDPEKSFAGWPDFKSIPELKKEHRFEEGWYVELPVLFGQQAAEFPPKNLAACVVSRTRPEGHVLLAKTSLCLLGHEKIASVVIEDKAMVTEIAKGTLDEKNYGATLSAIHRPTVVLELTNGQQTIVIGFNIDDATATSHSGDIVQISEKLRALLKKLVAEHLEKKLK